MNKCFILVIFLLVCPILVFGQGRGPARGGGRPDRVAPLPGGGSDDGWMVTVNQMDDNRRGMITRTVENLQEQGGATRGIITSMLASAGTAGLSTLIDIAATEIIKLAQYRQTQKRNWMQMIQNECSYTDSISSIRGLRVFYKETPRYGALDPSNINYVAILGDCFVALRSFMPISGSERMWGTGEYNMKVRFGETC